MTFDEWVKSRQDARQWSEDERACAEIAWNEATKITRGETNEGNMATKNGSHLCARCGSIFCDNGCRNNSDGVA